MKNSMLIIESPDSPVSVAIEPSTGLPSEILVDGGGVAYRQILTVRIGADVSGTERRNPTGGVLYDATRALRDVVCTSLSPSRTHHGLWDEYALGAALGPLNLKLAYRLFPTAPYLEMVVTIGAAQDVFIRNVRFTIEVVGDPSAQILNIPGNQVHRGLRVSDLGEDPLGVSPIGGLRGSSGLVALTTAGVTTTVWPNQPTEIPDIIVRSMEHGLAIDVDTNLAAVVGSSNSVELALAALDLQAVDFTGLKAQWGDWAARANLTTPHTKPNWVRAARIYEAQIGTSYFWGGNSYTRYCDIAELTADLERIQNLGFSVIQIMPRQPYPSYNVHDYADISTSYGDEDQLKQLIDAAHARHMRVILDVLLHGVLDNESVDLALTGIQTGPLAARLNEETGDSFSSDLSDSTNYSIAWSRHILDFAESWKGGSPAKTPLEDDHPDWFFRDSSGAVTGVYTKAFDARNRSWQRYFRSSMVRLVSALDIDGFRFDAPTYNNFANWADWAKARASLSPLGCVPLFVDLRSDIKNAKPDAVMYTEPSGHLLRRSMDVNYNYDEQWLVTALAFPDLAVTRGVTTARQFMNWIEDRDAFLPPGSQTAHHIDSHDTFWWPQWGKKWRREQFGIEKVKALTLAMSILDGPYMMFTGGEEGIEDELRMILGLRRDKPELWDIPATFGSDTDQDDNLFVCKRRSSTEEVVLVVNLTGTSSISISASLHVGWNQMSSSGLVEQAIAPAGYGLFLRSLDPRT